MLRVNPLIGFGARRPAAGGLSELIDIYGSGCHAWWDGRDTDQITLNTTPDPDTVTNWVAKGENAWDLAQTVGDSVRPDYDAANGRLNFAGSDYLIATASGLSSLTNHSLWMAGIVKSSVAGDMLFGRSIASGEFIGRITSGASNAITSGAGSPGVYVDGTLVSPSTDGQFYTDLPLDSACVIEFRNCDFTSWTNGFGINSWNAGWRVPSYHYQVAITDDPTAGERTSTVSFLNSVMA